MPLTKRLQNVPSQIFNSVLNALLVNTITAIRKFFCLHHGTINEP